MPDLNKCFVMGNLTRDPEVRYTPKGTAVGEMCIAVNHTYKSPDGQTKEEVTYVDIVTWDRTAENCKEYLFKGRPVFVEGRLQLDQWETKEGEKRSRMRVRAEKVQFLGGRPEGQGGARRDEMDQRREEKPAARYPARQEPPAQPADDGGFSDEETPF